jgi:uncharacterized protein
LENAWTIAVLAAATAAAGILRGYSGFGGALVMAPAFLRVTSPAESVALISVVHLLTSLQGVGPSLQLADRGILVPLGIAAIVGVPLGIVLLGWLEPQAVKTIVALVVIALAIAIGFGVRPTGKPARWKSLIAGALSGALNGFCGIGGPPAVLYVLGTGKQAVELRASFILYFALLYPITMLGLALTGFVSVHAVLIGTALAPVFFLTTHLGHAMFHRLKSRWFVPVCMAVLSLSGLAMLFA